MGNNTEGKPPLGGWFGTLGAILGGLYGLQIAPADSLVPLGGVIVGGMLGLLVENIIFRLLLVAMLLIVIFARHAFIEAVIEQFGAMEIIPSAYAEEVRQCAPLAKTSYGKDHDADTSAHIYSQDHIGNVGISIYPGYDLEANGFTADKLGEVIVTALKGKGVKAECFINPTMFDNSGTALTFIINGLSIKMDGDDTFNMDQVWNDKRILRATVAEAKTVEALQANAN